MTARSAARLSVVIAARNAARFLPLTLDSLRVQTEPAFEVIVVDDGSTDATAAQVDVVAAVDPRFRRVAGAACGVSAARNLGLAEAGAGLVLFLDADDLLAPDALARFAGALADPAAVAVLGGVQRITEEGQPLPGTDNRELARGTDQLAALLRKNFVVNGGALAIRHEAALAAGGYDGALRYGEDWEFWCRLAVRGRFAILEGEPVLLYRQVASGANYRARGSALARDLPCLDRIAENPDLRRRFGRQLPRLLRARRIDIFWSGVRSEVQFGRKGRAVMLGAVGLLLYPDTLLRPGLALRFLRSVRP